MSDSVLPRRVVLMAGALVPAIWVTPQLLSVPIAWATPPGSAPPKTPTPQPQMGPPLPRDLPGLLPFTGQNAIEHAELGVAAVVAGAAVVGLTRERRKLT